MQTEIIKVTDKNCSDTVKRAADVLRLGGLVAFPTETVYGLGGNGLDAQASGKIYAAKGRPSDNPLILHIAEREQLCDIAQGIDARAEALMDAFWPGPLTLILKKAPKVPYETTGGLDTVAVRMPSHPVAAALLRAVKLPIAAPSANTSGRPSPTAAEHVIEDMSGRIDMILDGGSVGIGVESTIIDLTEEIPMLLRPGFITLDMAEHVIGRVDVDKAVTRQVSADVRPKAPGMKYRHYAPKAAMEIVDGDICKVVDYVNTQAEALKRENKKVGVLATDETKGMYNADTVLSVGSRESIESVAHNLFGVLRAFDACKVDCIFSESFPDEGEGSAVMNRLRKAAGHNIKRV